MMINEAHVQRAAFHSNIERLRWMSENGFEINICDKRGIPTIQMALYGALYLPRGNRAIKKRTDETIRLIVSRGADVNLVDAEGDSLLHIAVKAYPNNRLSKQSIRLLLELGVDKNAKDGCDRTASKHAYNNGLYSLGDLITRHVAKLNKACNGVVYLVKSINSIMLRRTMSLPCVDTDDEEYGPTQITTNYQDDDDDNTNLFVLSNVSERQKLDFEYVTIPCL